MVDRSNDPALFYEQLGFTGLFLHRDSPHEILWSWFHPVNDLFDRDAVSWSHRDTPYLLFKRTGCGGWIEDTDLNTLYIRIPLQYRGLTDHVKLIEPWLSMLQEMGLTIKQVQLYKKWIGFEINDLPGSAGLMAVQLLRSLCLSVVYNSQLGFFNDWYGCLVGHIWLPQAALFWKSLGYPTYLALWAGSQSYAWRGSSSRTPYYGGDWLVQLYRQYKTLHGADTTIVPINSLWGDTISMNRHRNDPVEFPIPITTGFTESDYKYLVGPYTHQRLLTGCPEAIRFMEALINTPLETIMDNVMSTYYSVVLGADLFWDYSSNTPPPYILYARGLAVLGLLTCDLHLIIKAQLLRLINKTNVADLVKALKQNWAKIAAYSEMRQCVVDPALLTDIFGSRIGSLTNCQTQA